MSQDMSFFSAILWAQKLRSRNFVWQIPCRSSSSSSSEGDRFLARLSPSCRLENLATTEAAAVIIEFKSAITFNWWSWQVFNSGHHLSPLMATRLAFAWYCDFYENIGIICREKAFAGFHDTLTFMKILTSSAERKQNWVIIATFSCSFSSVDQTSVTVVGLIDSPVLNLSALLFNFCTRGKIGRHWSHLWNPHNVNSVHRFHQTYAQETFASTIQCNG